MSGRTFPLEALLAAALLLVGGVGRPVAHADITPELGALARLFRSPLTEPGGPRRLARIELPGSDGSDDADDNDDDGDDTDTTNGAGTDDDEDAGPAPLSEAERDRLADRIDAYMKGGALPRVSFAGLSILYQELRAGDPEHTPASFLEAYREAFRPADAEDEGDPAPASFEEDMLATLSTARAREARTGEVDDDFTRSDGFAPPDDADID